MSEKEFKFQVDQWDDIQEDMWLKGGYEKPEWVCHMDATPLKKRILGPLWLRPWDWFKGD